MYSYVNGEKTVSLPEFIENINNFKGIMFHLFKIFLLNFKFTSLQCICLVVTEGVRIRSSRRNYRNSALPCGMLSRRRGRTGGLSRQDLHKTAALCTTITDN